MQAPQIKTMDLAAKTDLSASKKSEESKALKKKGESMKKSDEESFEPEYHQIKKMGFKVNKSKITVGEWNYQENQIYLQFMIDNLADFLSQKSRRKTKVFYRLSKILKKRTPDQCRSHHQKLQLKYKDDLCSIIGEVYKKIQKSIAQEYVDYQHRMHLQNYQKMRELNKTGVEEQPKDDGTIDGKWYQIRKSKNHFLISIIETEVGEWQAES